MAPAVPELQVAINDFVLQLQRRQVEGSLDSAKLTVLLLRQVVSQHRASHSGQASALIEAVKNVGVRLIAASPIELAIGNIVRRVLHIIREEEVSVTNSTEAEVGAGFESDDNDNNDNDNDSPPGLSAALLAAANRSALRGPSLYNLLESGSMPSAAVVPLSSGGDSEDRSRSCEKNSKGWKLKHAVIEGINELLEDINNNHAQIAEQALEHIHQDEVILTLGHSRTLLQFLCEAKKKRSFQVFIAEGAPRYQGHTLAKELADLNLQTTLITDSAVFAMISRVDMVIIGAHAVMANGGVIAPTGLHMVALAARRHAVPFVVLAGMYKLCPLYPHNPYVLVNEMKSPSQILEFEDMSEYVEAALGGPAMHATNPTFDYIPPELVSLFITDMGGHNPSYIYRLVAEYYSPEDYSLE
ncbi:hypothetical protein GOP47_0014619 [Adiantum capillus-veneris]|uniref:Translation initiation factor eIF2B subunit beta n=1 Tax=Adiantum capillus-veneris TaxID=13818 RepID=A0A9D4UMK5_ADICA|nr:hypothetical protein GOP47_0014619 [Adiantum capillus-veneris]